MLARRGFLGAVAAGAAALTGWSALTWGDSPQARAARPRQGSPWRVPFNTGWLFGPAEPGCTAPGWDDSGLTRVTPPHTVTQLSWRDWDPGTWERTWVYRKHFTLPPRARGKRVFLDIGAALTKVTPVLNGRALPGRTGGYLPTRIELTEFLEPGENVLALMVDSRFGFDVPPDRPARYDSRSIDFWQPGGLYRDVSVVIVPQVFLDDVYAKPVRVLDPAARRLEVACTVDAAVAPPADAPVSVEVSLLDETRVVSSARVPARIRRDGRVTVTATLAGLERVTLWDTENPKLYTVRATLRVAGAPVHDYQVRTGFRSVSFTADGFFLNGRRLKLTGLNRHQFYPFAGGALPARVQRRDALILRRELNCNVVRCSHYPQSEDFLDACDELGLLVWEEMPGWRYLGDAAWREAASRDLRDMIIRDRGHPSIVVWGAMPDEAGPHPDVYARFRALAHALDDTRPTGGDGSRTDPRFAFEVLGFHDYRGLIGPEGLRHPVPLPAVDAAHKPFLVCEAVGALSGPSCAYRRTSPQELQQGQAAAHGRAHGAAAAEDRHCGVVAWSAFDYPSGASGLALGGVKYTGVADQFRILKPGAAIYQSQVDPRVRPVIAPAFYWDLGSAYPVTSLTRAMICSNLDRLEIYVGGAHHSTVTPSPAGFGRLPYPPSFADFSGIRHPAAGSSAAPPELRIDGYLAGVKVASRVFSADTSRDRLAVAADDASLVADGADATRVVFRAVDAHGNPRPYVTGSVTLTVAGPGTLVGDSPFAFGDAGGAGAVWIRTLPGAAGPITVTASHPVLGSGTVTITAVPPVTAPAIGAGPPGPLPSGALTASLSREVAAPGDRVTLTASFTCDGEATLTSVTLEPVLPPGWTVAGPAPAARYGGVATGRSVRASWDVTVPDGAAPLDAALTVLARYAAGPRRGTVSASVTARVPHRSVAAAFGNTGTTPAGSAGGSRDGLDGTGGSGDGFDGTGARYPAAALAAAGLRPGAAVRTPDGLTYTWPDVPPGHPDNALGTGQTVLLAGAPGATLLGLLCAGTRAACFGTIVVHYADGTRDVRVAYIPNWTFGRAAGGPAANAPEQRFATAAVLPYHDRPGGRGGPVCVYAVTVPVDPARRVAAVTLPDRSATVSPVTNTVHIFSLTTGTPAVYPSLEAAFNNTGTSDDTPLPGGITRLAEGGLDGAGLSLSRQELAAAGLRPGAAVTRDGLRFTWPDVPPGNPDNVLALGQTVQVPGAGRRLGILGASWPEPAMGTGTVHYADGTASDFTLTLNSLAHRPGGGSTSAATMRYLNDPAGRRPGPAHLFSASVPLIPGKPVIAVTLPPNGALSPAGPTWGMHIFSLAIG